MRRVVVIAAVFGCLFCGASAAIAQALDRRLFASESVYELHLANRPIAAAMRTEMGLSSRTSLPATMRCQ